MRNDINFMLYSNFAAMKEAKKKLFVQNAIGWPINRRNIEDCQQIPEISEAPANIRTNNL